MSHGDGPVSRRRRLVATTPVGAPAASAMTPSCPRNSRRREGFGRSCIAFSNLLVVASELHCRARVAPGQVTGRRERRVVSVNSLVSGGRKKLMRSILRIAATLAATLAALSCGGTTGADRNNSIATACDENIADPNCHTV